MNTNQNITNPNTVVFNNVIAKILGYLTLILLVITIIFLVLYFITTLSGNVQRTITLSDNSEKSVTDIDNSYFGDLTARNIRYNIQIFIGVK